MMSLHLRYAALLLFATSAHAQYVASDHVEAQLISLPDAPEAGSSTPVQSSSTGHLPRAPSSEGPVEASAQSPLGSSNLRSYSADQILPPQTVREKFKLGLQDSFGYYSVALVAAEAGVHQASNQYPALRQGAAGYGRYYWHGFADQADENLWTVSILPSALHEDSRYYRLGHGGFVKRTAYALSRTLITRSDTGDATVNFSEIVGSGAAAGISSTYYPAQYRTWTKTGQRWLSNGIVDGATFAVKEFWPDLERLVRHHP